MKGGLTTALLVALVVGFQLGGVPWRYRRQFWQLQGAIAGAVAGYLMGDGADEPLSILTSQQRHAMRHLHR